MNLPIIPIVFFICKLTPAAFLQLSYQARLKPSQRPNIPLPHGPLHQTLKLSDIIDQNLSVFVKLMNQNTTMEDTN